MQNTVIQKKFFQKNMYNMFLFIIQIFIVFSIQACDPICCVSPYETSVTAFYSKHELGNVISDVSGMQQGIITYNNVNIYDSANDYSIKYLRQNYSIRADSGVISFDYENADFDNKVFDEVSRRGFGSIGSQASVFDNFKDNKLNINYRYKERAILFRDESYREDRETGERIEEIGALYDSNRKEYKSLAEYEEKNKQERNQNILEYFEKGANVISHIKISNSFQGKVFMFFNVSVYFDFKDDKIYLTYGKPIADKLAEAGITYIDVDKKFTVKENDFIILNPLSAPVSVRALMKAAEEVNDYRLLIIERTGVGSDNKVNITAFGQTTQVDAGTTYEWKFDEAQASEIRKYVKYIESLEKVGSGG